MHHEMATGIMMDRYSAKLLFQFLVCSADPAKRRHCEERIICYEAHDHERAIRLAKRIGHASEYSYLNSDEDRVEFEFIGTMDILQLGLECSDNEVWYDIYIRKLPMERKHTLTRSNSELLQRLKTNTKTRYAQNE